jgi:hypothetical protein
MVLSTAPESRARTQALIRETEVPEHRRMLQIWLDHWWAEVVYDIDTAMSTVTENVWYSFFGFPMYGEPQKITSREGARQVYQSMFDDGLMPGGPFDEERWAFGTWGMTLEAVFTSVYPGRMLSGLPQPLVPDLLYLIRWPMTVVFPIDLEKNQLRAEIMYSGEPFSIEPSDRATIARLLGRTA